MTWQTTEREQMYKLFSTFSTWSGHSGGVQTKYLVGGKSYKLKACVSWNHF